MRMRIFDLALLELHELGIRKTYPNQNSSPPAILIRMEIPTSIIPAKAGIR